MLSHQRFAKEETSRRVGAGESGSRGVIGESADRTSNRGQQGPGLGSRPSPSQGVRMRWHPITHPYRFAKPAPTSLEM